jgi:iron complex outermembrane receptor protein
MNTTNLAYNGLVTVRGFVSQGLAYIDGLPANLVLDGASLSDFANISRIEVIKGPNGVLYGSHVPGGIIDMITKKPEFTAATDLTTIVGAFDLYRGQLDVTGPLGDSHAAYRVIAMGQYGKTDNDGPNYKRLITPSFTWQPSAKTTVTASFEYYNPDIGTSRTQWFDDAAGKISFFLPTSRYYDDQDEHRTNWDYLTNIGLEQAISDAWKVRLVVRNIDLAENKLNYTHGTFSFLSTTGAPLLTPSRAAATTANYTFAQAFANPLFGDITMARQRQLNIIKAHHPGVFADIVDTADIGILHNILLTSIQVVGDSTDTKTYLWKYPSVSVFHPVYNSNTAAIATGETVSANNIAWDRDYSLGIQDNASLWNDRVNLVAGVRRDDAPEDTLNRVNGVRVAVTDMQNSYRGGAVVKLFGGLETFVNWSQTFTPVVGFDAYNNPLKNQVATIREAGFKEDAFDGRLTATVSVYAIKQTNASQVVVLNPATGLTGNAQTGFIQARGWETDLAWQATREITLLAGAGNISSETNAGIPTRGVGEGFDGKVFGKYSFRDGWIKGFTVGAGYDYNPHSPGDGAGSFYLPAYGLYDAFVSYSLPPHWRFQVNVENLTNKLYAAGAVSGAYITAGIPRDFRVTVEYSF